MLIETVSGLLQDYSHLLLLLSIGLLGFSTGLLRAPRCEQEQEESMIKCAERPEAEYKTGKHLGNRARMQREKGEELSMGVNAMHGQEKGKEEEGLKQGIVQDSSSRPGWLRSLSLRQRRQHSNAVNQQDSNPGLAPETAEKGVQRKASLTGEEVKVLADAFIARVRQRMRVQRQESLKLHPHSQASFEAPPLP